MLPEKGIYVPITQAVCPLFEPRAIRLKAELESYRVPDGQRTTERGLLRVIGVRRLMASTINATIGAGIFVLPAIVAAGLGPAAPLAYLVCGGLMALIVAGVWFVKGEHLAVTALPSASALGRTSIVLIFAFVGVEMALVPSGEMSDPARTVPLALFAALAVTTSIYLAVQAVALGILGPAMADDAAAPLAGVRGDN